MLTVNLKNTNISTPKLQKFTLTPSIHRYFTDTPKFPSDIDPLALVISFKLIKMPKVTFLSFYKFNFSISLLVCLLIMEYILFMSFYRKCNKNNCYTIQKVIF